MPAHGARGDARGALPRPQRRRDALTRHPATKVYLDGTHSAWLGVGDIAQRLVRAGVQRARGFFLNVSNFQTTSRQLKYGTWISECIAYATAVQGDAAGGPTASSACGSQYYPADPNDESTWHKTDEWYAANLGNAVPTAHFVIDTSRNGQGPWAGPADYPAGSRPRGVVQPARPRPGSAPEHAHGQPAG